MSNELRENNKSDTSGIGGKRHPMEAWVEQEGFGKDLIEQFPKAAAVFNQKGMDRRTFLQLMGASLAAAGLSGCVTATAPNEEIIPYVRVPEEVIPGNPIYFASAMTLGGVATGVLIETHEGRPTRIEGNANHPASLGSSYLYAQASILELYNPNRSVATRREETFSTWGSFRQALTSTLSSLASRQGEGLYILTEAISSPTLISQMNAVLEQYPNARWHQHEPVSDDNASEGSRLAFGEPVSTHYDFSQADVVVSLDSNFLNENVRYAREFITNRKLRQGDAPTMSRLYAIESSPTITGANADHRQAMRASSVESFARALANGLGVSGGEPSVSDAWDDALLNAIVDDLQAHSGASIVIPGRNQPPAVHALAHAINDALGNVGSTVFYTEPVHTVIGEQIGDLPTLVSEMEAGNVEALIILGGNPVYSSPADIDFASALSLVPLSAHLSLYYDETSQECVWHIPQTHFIEEWSDARTFDGTVSIVQPPIGPLYDEVRSAHEVVAVLLNDVRPGYAILRSYWENQFQGENFEQAWRRALHDGIWEGTAFDTITPTLSLDSSVADAAGGGGEGLEIIFRPDPTLWDGRFAFNSWLQEIPKPITNTTWDNVGLISEATASSLGLNSEDLVELSYQGNTMPIPLLITPGHPDDAITISLGFGRGLSADVQAGLSFNAYTLRRSDALWFDGGAAIAATGTQYPIAITRGDFQVDEVENVITGTLREYIDNPEFVKEGKDEKDATLLDENVYDYSENNAWGMSIDLTACIGCNACVLACQTENNIPTVGKPEVLRGREMHWIRVDAYTVGDGADATTDFQPVPCMHCENAPCEQVCPVQATVHSNDGLNMMVYNRCVGTRYCSANCPYNVRRFNFFDYIDPDLIIWELRNPDVSVRVEGVMEKCTYCVQRIKAVEIEANKTDRPIEDGEITPACAAACPTQAIVFGNINDEDAQVAIEKAQPRSYGLLTELNTVPRTTYLARISNPNEALGGSEEE
ncbi:MAG: 4Fe-4S dicluster domain-containing protein [Anaerolineae bacterium]